MRKKKVVYVLLIIFYDNFNIVSISVRVFMIKCGLPSNWL